MRTVGIRQFRDQATTLMKLGETIRIERNGKPIGFFVPVPTPKHNRREIIESYDRVGEAVGRVLQATGLNEEELVRAIAPEDSE
ncbi:MAG: hypothetical protein OXS29_08420 [bacterium]|nr:hypothetical protein [bacterium]MDE0287429.1 hypothetical protein [bacterium]MDE0436874.1 hypothetical protein [bacterium]